MRGRVGGKGRKGGAKSKGLVWVCGGCGEQSQALSSKNGGGEPGTEATTLPSVPGSPPPVFRGESLGPRLGSVVGVGVLGSVEGVGLGAWWVSFP